MSLMRARVSERRCPVHDVATPRKTAELEVATGVDPNAVAELEARAWAPVVPRGLVDPRAFIAAFNDPDLTDCGRQWCRERRGLA